MKTILLTAFAACAFSASQSQPKLTATQQAATDLFQAGKPDEATPLFKKAIAENGKDKYSMNALDIIYFNEGKYAEVYEMSGKGIAATGGELPFVIMHAKAAFLLNKHAEVIKLSDNYNAKHPVNTDLLYLKGRALQSSGDAQGAMAAYSQSIAANSEYSEPYLMRGKYFSELGRIALALKDYDKYISLQPDDYEGYSVRGVAYANSGKMDEALADYNKSIALNPKDHYAFCHRAEIYAARKDATNAASDFNKAIALAPDYAEAYAQLARLYGGGGPEAAKSLPLINKAISLQPANAAFYSELSRDLSTLDRYAEALTAAEKAIALAPKNGEGYMWKAIALSNANKADEAIAAAGAGLAIAPDYYLLYATRASIYRMNGKAALADADDAKAKELAAK